MPYLLSGIGIAVGLYMLLVIAVIVLGCIVNTYNPPPE